MRELYIIRGLPGSGKSTFAQKIASKHYEADQFFMKDGRYIYDREKIDEAHKNCQEKVRHSMEYESTPIVVSNTFVRRWEIQPYIEMAAQYGYRVTEITMSGPLYPNVHQVPNEVIERMREKWEK